MADHRRRVDRRRTRLGIEPGEMVLSACLTEPRGGRSATERVAARVGRTPSIDDGPSRDLAPWMRTLADRLPERGHVVALTDRRLIAFDRSAVRHRPTEVVCAWTALELAGLHVKPHGRRHLMSVVFSDRSILQLEVTRRSRPMAMFAAWNALHPS